MLSLFPRNDKVIYSYFLRTLKLWGQVFPFHVWNLRQQRQQQNQTMGCTEDLDGNSESLGYNLGIYAASVRGCVVFRGESEAVYTSDSRKVSKDCQRSSSCLCSFLLYFRSNKKTSSVVAVQILRKRECWVWHPVTLVWSTHLHTISGEFFPFMSSKLQSVRCNKLWPSTRLQAVLFLILSSGFSLSEQDQAGSGLETNSVVCMYAGSMPSFAWDR
jgi:hypothetical protein